MNIGKIGELKTSGLKPLNFNPGSMLGRTVPASPPPSDYHSLNQPYGTMLSVNHGDVVHSVKKALERFNDVEQASGSITLKLRNQAPKTLSFQLKK